MLVLPRVTIPCLHDTTPDAQSRVLRARLSVDCRPGVDLHTQRSRQCAGRSRSLDIVDPAHPGGSDKARAKDAGTQGTSREADGSGRAVRPFEWRHLELELGADLAERDRDAVPFHRRDTMLGDVRPIAVEHQYRADGERA